MPIKTFKAGIVNESNLNLLVQANPSTPFTKGHVNVCGQLVVDVDFVTGDDVVIELEGHPTVFHASITTGDGTVVTYTEAALTGVLGRKLTMAAVATNLKLDIKASI